MALKTLAIASLVGAVMLSGKPVRAVDVVGMDHFAINVHDVQKSADWYQNVFGFSVLHKWDNAWMIGRGNVKIGLFIAPNAKPVPDRANSIEILKIAFLVDGDKFAEVISELKSKGIAVSATEDTGIAYSVFIHDPDGYTLEFTTFHGNGSPPKLQK